MPIYRGLGYRGVYLGGVHDYAVIERILQRERSFGVDDWKEFARDLQFSRPDEFCFYAQDPVTRLADPTRRGEQPREKSKHVSVAYGLSKWTHNLMFTPGKLSRSAAKSCAEAADPRQGPRLMRLIEHASKAALFACKDCGDCSLPEIAFLCPESQCAKNQRNGPCGGTRDGRCEVDGYGDCIWLRAYERLKHDGHADQLVAHAPVVQDQSLRGTSSWANHWLGRDHVHRSFLEPASPASAVTTAPPLTSSASSSVKACPA